MKWMKKYNLNLEITLKSKKKVNFLKKNTGSTLKKNVSSGSWKYTNCDVLWKTEEMVNNGIWQKLELKSKLGQFLSSFEN